MKYKKIYCLLWVAVIFCMNILSSAAYAGSFKEEALSEFINKQMKKSKIPGMMVVVVKEDKTIYSQGFGYTSFENKKKIKESTLFELGSTSKAYTALGIALLEEKGLISKEDSIKKYIPWLQLYYNQKPVDITIQNLLYHTSGIPFNTIGDIPISKDKNAIEITVRKLVGKELDAYPGERYNYATINYDILGLVIEKVTKKSFENFMDIEIFKPLGLLNTTTNKEEALKKEMSKGHKIKFGKAKIYEAPEYRGNVPAGYIITNGQDIQKWLKIQIGRIKIDSLLEKAIQNTHIPNRTVMPQYDGSSYAGGWNVYQDGGGEYSHGGENPNFSSFILFRPKEKLGVAVLANMNTTYTRTIGQGIGDILMDKIPKEKTKDTYREMDYIAFACICIFIPFTLFTLWSILKLIYDILKKERAYNGSIKKNTVYIGKLIFSIGIFHSFLYFIPKTLFEDLPWHFLAVWAPESIKIAMITLLIGGNLFIFYYYFHQLFSKKEDPSFFPLITVSIMSGFGNALIIFVVNEALNRFEIYKGRIEVGLLFYFIVGILVYILGQRMVRLKLISMTSTIVYKKRVDLIHKILKTPYQDLENLEKGELIACLNNDTETISSFADIIITAVANTVTLICCFIYLGLISIIGLALSVGIAFLALGLYYFVGLSAEKLWETVRDNKSIFIDYIQDLIHGFKELSVNHRKKAQFKEDMIKSCKTYKEKNIEGNFKFANVFILGELLFTLVIGGIAFVFPIVFKEIEGATLMQYVFIFLYMTGPIHGIIGAVPEIMQVRISWNRINKLQEKLSSLSSLEILKEEMIDEKIEICLENVIFSYKGKEDADFGVGPLNCTFKPGEITFITGGNGSGKSTLAKIITGLYRPEKGRILVNKKEVNSDNLGRYYSAIFSDYYLFNKLYGIDYEKKKENIKEKMKALQIDHKIQIKEGKLSSIKLSSGQRKRIALMMSYLEDLPVCMFDEWAADQDPEFRKIFYVEILPELKNKGKCVIAITHDDAYFETADKVIKMEMGKIVN